MEEKTHLSASRNGYRGHVTRLFNKIDRLIAADFDEYTITSLNNAVEQLTRKMEKILQIDDQLLKTFDDASELELSVLDAEELHDEITDKIARTRRYIELNSMEQPGRVSPVHQTSEESQSESIVTSLVEQPSVTTQGVNESGLESVSTTTTQVIPSTVTYTTAGNHNTIDTTITHHVSGPSPVTTTTFSNVIGPPPLIPVISHTSLSSVSSQRPSTTTVFAPRSLYESPMSTRLDPMIQPFTPSRSTQPFTSSRLPKLTLPMFSGDPLTWQTFWDSFYVSIHANHSLSGIQKFTYLKAQLEGDAARAIAGLPLTDANYIHSIALLEERYAQPHKLVNAHMKALLEMPSPTNSLDSLRIFYDSVESHIRGLSSLGKSEHSYGDILVPVLLGKLSPDIRRNLAREHSNSQWILADLMTAILKEIRVLESGLYDSHNPMPRSTAASLHINSLESAKKQHRDNESKKRQQQCVFCKKNHSAHNCDVVTDYQKRFDIVKEGRRCYNCLAHHRVSQCTSKSRCRKCKRKHHTSLCSSGSPTKDTIPEKNTSDNPPTTTTGGFLTPASCSEAPRNPTCLLKTAVAPIVAGNTRSQANILFDEGAQRSFISAEMANELQISPTSTADIAVASFGTTSTNTQKLGVTTVEVETESGELIPISVLIVPSIAAPIQNLVSTSVYTMPHLRDLKLAHPVTSDKDFTISLLIGTDHYWSFVEDHIIRGKGPTAQRSKLGYLLSGPLPGVLSDSTSSALLQITSEVPTSEQSLPNLEKFWSVEGIGTDKVTQSRDLTFLQSYQESAISQTNEGTYVAKFPWKMDKPDLPSNFATCKGRTLTLVNKLRKSPELLQLYDGIIKEQERRGFIERVNDDTTYDVHYLPHHPVKKDSLTTPIRIVYDCSCRGSGQSASLNDCLTVGPPFLNNLCAILLRFRIHAFALSTDIEKAFLHVKLHPSDRNFTRFLWPSHLESNDIQFQTYRFTVVPFGASSSPFILGAVLDLHLSKSPLQVAADMRDNIYVDNILSGCNTEEELLAYYSQSRDLMNQAKFNLRSWSTNSKQLQEVTRQDNTSDPNTTVGILGLRWNTTTDMLSLSTRKLPAINTSVTKREILQASSQIFDPLGWVTPVTVRAKILLQEIWQTKLTWDEPLPDMIMDKWIAILADLRELPNLLVPRLYFPPSQTGTHIDNLFVFADASTKAYGAIVYLNSGNHISLAMSKNRVAPTRVITLPRLELMAAVTATRLTAFVCSSIPYDKQ